MSAETARVAVPSGALIVTVSKPLESGREITLLGNALTHEALSTKAVWDPSDHGSKGLKFESSRAHAQRQRVKPDQLFLVAGVAGVVLLVAAGCNQADLRVRDGPIEWP